MNVRPKWLTSLLNFLLGIIGPKKAPRIVFTEIRFDSICIKGNIMGTKLPLDKQFKITVAPQDAAGKPAQVEGVPVWTASSDLVTIIPAPDGLSAVVEPNFNGDVGSTQVNVTADADVGEGVETITGVLDVDVIGGKAVSLAMSVGPLEPLSTT